MQASPLVSIIIVNYNGKRSLKRCVESALSTECPSLEIVLVDNASTDGSLEEINNIVNRNNRVKITTNSRNLGHSEGCNVGARNSAGAFLAFLDNDIEVKPNWLSEIVNVMMRNKKIGAAQAKILFPDGKRVWATGEFIDECGNPVLAGYYDEDSSNGISPSEIFSPISAACVIRRDIFNEVGGLDKHFFVYNDDTDLGWRIRLLGYKTIVVPMSSVIHKVPVGKSPIRPLSYGILNFHKRKNQLMMLLKNYEISDIFRVLPLVLINYLFWVLTDPLITIRSLVWILCKLKEIMKKRVLTSYLKKGRRTDVKKFILSSKFTMAYTLLWLLLYRKKVSVSTFLCRSLSFKLKQRFNSKNLSLRLVPDENNDGKGLL